MLVIIVPFRATNQPERREHLTIFLNVMPVLLPSAKIIIAEQEDDGALFNIGLLMNICFLQSNIKDTDTVCIHHVDLIPHENIILEYTKVLPPKTMRHIGSAWTRYQKKHFCTGVILMHASDFRAVNGFPNDMWGWGGEDVILGRRIKARNIQVERCTGIIHDQENMKTVHEKFQHLKDTKALGKNLFKRMRWYRQDENLYLRGLRQVPCYSTEQVVKGSILRVLVSFETSQHASKCMSAIRNP